jgi:MFS transporter, UMF1 family
MTKTGLPGKDNKKIINAWATYDLANSVYNLVITATIFPIYYKIVTTNKEAPKGAENIVSFLGMQLKNTTLYDYSLAFAYLIIVSIAPLLSGIADYSGKKKRFMQFFCYLGAVSCSLMYFFDKDNLSFGILLAILACIGFSGSLVFYNAYLPEIASPGKQDYVSARGFAMGYVGSSVLLIVNLIMVQTQETGPEKLEMMRYSFLMVGAWWFLFSFIPFYYLPNFPVSHRVEGNRLTKGYAELRKVWKELRKNPRLTRFLTAFFVYSMGVQTVMLVANHFGSEEIKMEPGQLITTILIIQFVAMGGSFLFSWISSRLGNIFALKTATVIWSLICLVTFFLVFTPGHFMIVAACVGLVMGGIQSLSRSTYSKFLPETQDHASYFSFYDVCEKLSIVFGMGLFGFINELSSGMRQPIIVLISFFVIGFLLLLRIPKSNPS